MGDAHADLAPSTRDKMPVGYWQLLQSLIELPSGIEWGKFVPGVSDVALAKTSVEGLGARIFGLGRGDRLTLVGIHRDGIKEALKMERADTRSALLIDSTDRQDADTILDSLLDDLAELAVERWPRWYGWNESTSHGLVEHAAADRLVSAPWLRAAIKRVSAGRVPRFRKAPK